MTPHGPAAVVLAAGAGERMGRAKQLLPYGRSTLVERAVDAALGAGLETVVVTGFHAARVEGVLAGRPVRIVRNPDPARGNLSSLRVAVATLDAGRPLVLLLGDTPDVDAEVVRALVDAWRRDPAWAAICRYRDGRAHPLLLGPQAVAGLADLEGPKPLWRYLGTEARGRVLEVPIDRPAPVDVDTPADYEEALRRRGA